MIWRTSYIGPDGKIVKGETVEADARLHAHVLARQQFVDNPDTSPDFQTENDPEIIVKPAG